VRNALAALPGVKHVYFDFKTKVATVSVEKSAEKKDDTRMVTALEDVGFGGKVIDQGKMPE